MALFTRIGRLFRADLHAVLDSIEEPAEVLRQSIRDMKDVISDGEDEVRVGERQLARLRRQAEAIETDIQGLDRELDTCFETGEQELARAVVRKKLGAAGRLKKVDAAIADLTSLQADRSATLARQSETVEALRQKAELFAATATAEPPDSGNRRGTVPVVSEDDVEIALLQEQRARSGS